jgi:superfamily II DNA or RNA helicase
MNLRKYQSKAISDIFSEFALGKKSVCCVLPTGAGKTTVGVNSALTHILQTRGASVVWLAPLKELTLQAKRYFPTSVDVVTVDEDTESQETMFPRIHISTVQSLSHRGRKFRPRATFVVLDEAQFFFGTPEWNQVAKYYIERGAKVLSLTATPSRQDGSPLSGLADGLVTGPSVRELIELKHLCRCDVFSITDSYIERSPIDAYLKYAKNSKAAVFCSTVDDAKDLSQDFNDCGVTSTFAHAGDRSGVELHKNNDVKVLCNVYLLSYGYDDPSIETIILNRNCNNPSVYLQMVGRGLRPFEGKQSAKFIDMFGVIHKQNFGLPDDERIYSLEGQAISLRASSDGEYKALVPGVDFTVIE